MCAYGSGESLCEVLGRECVVFAVAEVGEVEVAVILSYKVGEVDDSFLVAGVEQTYKIDSGVLYIFFGIFGRKNPFYGVGEGIGSGGVMPPLSSSSPPQALKAHIATAAANA